MAFALGAVGRVRAPLARSAPKALCSENGLKTFSYVLEVCNLPAGHD